MTASEEKSVYRTERDEHPKNRREIIRRTSK